MKTWHSDDLQALFVSNTPVFSHFKDFKGNRTSGSARSLKWGVELWECFSGLGQVDGF